MLSIAFSAMIAASLGQLPPPGYGYFPGYAGCNSTGGAGWCVSGSLPCCNRDTYIGCGSWIGAFPSGMACPGTTAQWGGPCQGGFCPIQPFYVEQHSFPVQSGVLGRVEDEKEHKEINHRLEQLKLFLSKMADSLKEMEKRVEATEKASLSTETKVKGLQDELKHRWLLQDIEIRLDQRIKPLEESLKQLSRRLEQLHQQHEQSKSPDAKKSGDEGLDKMLLSIDVKIDQLHINVSDQLKKLNDQLNEERVLRGRLEDRIGKLEKGGGPPPKVEVKEKKDDVKKDEKKEEPKKELKKDDFKKDDKGDILNLSKLKVARVSLVHGGAPADRAVLIVHVPADARLYLNGQLTTSVGTQRTFVTPQLEVGATFVYNLRVELTHRGELLTQTRTVPFRAGAQAQVVFDGPRMGVQTAGK